MSPKPVSSVRDARTENKFFKESALGVGEARGSGGDGAECDLVTLTPFEVDSCAVDDGSEGAVRQSCSPSEDIDQGG